MRQAAKSKNRSRGPVSSCVSLPAPTGGWNARDALADMSQHDAITLENFFPTPTDVMLRKGYTQFCTGITGQVETLMNYSSPTAQTLFAIAGTSIYNVTAGGAVGAAVVTGLTNARFEYINISTSGGNFMMCVNGADKLRGWNGTAWWTDGDGTHDITGIDTATCSHIQLFKTRVWLVEENSLRVWYLPVNSIAGAASSLDFSSIAQKGGYLMAMGTWTLDAGQGADDYAVFITSNGEVIVYKGTDPSSANTWALAGVWSVGSPIGRRCFMKYAGDILLLTQDGLLPLASALQSSRLDPRVALTDKIYSAISSSTGLYGSNFGWKLAYFAKANMLILNVPISAGSGQQQYVMNTITKAWCKFTGIEANTWELLNDDLYFGGNGFVGKAWNGYSDNSTNVTGTAKQAFSYFGKHGQLKRFTMARPVLSSNGAPLLNFSINVDFEDVDLTTYDVFTPTTYGLWDSAVWDSAIWGSDVLLNIKQWKGVSGIGYAGASKLKIASMNIETHWASTDIVFESGGIL